MNRTEIRQQLLQQRQASSFAQRYAWDARIIELLREQLDKHPARKIGAYWPIRNEPDLRELLVELDQAGHEIGLPEVIIAHQPLRFLRWQREQALVTGNLGIPVPKQEITEDTAQQMTFKPDLLLVPCVGFLIDSQGQRYRLGYGGGYYDRTLASHPVPSIGIAYECSRIGADQFKPGRHDVPLNAVITEAGIF